MGMEFSPADVRTWPHGEQMADIYERSLTVARQLPRYGLRSLMIRMETGSDRPKVEFDSHPFMNLRLVRRVRSDITEMAHEFLPDASVELKGQCVDIIGIPAGAAASDMPSMQDKTWSMLQEHWGLVRQLPMPVRSIKTVFFDPVMTRTITRYNSIYPSLRTEAAAAFTSTEEQIGLYEWLHDNELQDNGVLSARADALSELFFKKGSANPSIFEIRVADGTPQGWAARRAEEEMFNAKYPDGLIPGLDYPLTEPPSQ